MEQIFYTCPYCRGVAIRSPLYGEPHSVVCWSARRTLTEADIAWAQAQDAAIIAQREGS